jgi:hypothetical protein
MKIIVFEKWKGALFYHCDERRRTKKGRPRGGFMAKLLKQYCPACQKRGPDAREYHNE